MAADLLWKETGHEHFSGEKKGVSLSMSGKILKDSSR